MTNSKITESKIDGRGIVVTWSDGQFVVFSMDLSIVTGNIDDKRMLVSKLSAQCTAGGCGVL